MRKNIIILLFVALCLGSCAKYQKVEINNISVADFSADLPKATISLTLNTELNNPNKRNIEITKAQGSIYKKGTHFADVNIADKYVITKGLNTIPFRINITVTDPIALLTLGFNYKNLQKSDFTINFEATIKSGPLKKNFKFENIPFSELEARIQNMLQ